MCAFRVGEKVDYCISYHKAFGFYGFFVGNKISWKIRGKCCASGYKTKKEDIKAMNDVIFQYNNLF